MTHLEQLPALVEALGVQISQLRDEMRAEFSAVRTEMQSGDEETRRGLREEIQAGDAETRRVLREEIQAGDAETRRVLREEIRDGLDRVMTHARALHEDVIGRLMLIQDGRRTKRR